MLITSCQLRLWWTRHLAASAQRWRKEFPRQNWKYIQYIWFYGLFYLWNVLIGLVLCLLNWKISRNETVQWEPVHTMHYSIGCKVMWFWYKKLRLFFSYAAYSHTMASVRRQYRHHLHLLIFSSSLSVPRGLVKNSTQPRATVPQQAVLWVTTRTTSLKRCRGSVWTHAEQITWAADYMRASTCVGLNTQNSHKRVCPKIWGKLMVHYWTAWDNPRGQVWYTIDVPKFLASHVGFKQKMYLQCTRFLINTDVEKGTVLLLVWYWSLAMQHFLDWCFLRVQRLVPACENCMRFWL